MTKPAASRGANRRRRKWIDHRMSELNPETDYAEIVRLSTLYRVNDLQLAWFYAVGTPAAGIAPAVIDSVWREGKGTYNTEPNRRRDDSVDHLMMWFEHGPSDAVTIASVDTVNKYHAHFARTYPEGFAQSDDYIYILCLNATLFHTAALQLRLPGFTAKQKRAAWIFWSQLADHFTLGTTGEKASDLSGFPTDFDAMVELVESYQERPWPVHAAGHESTISAIENFARTWFPRPLRPFGRALITTFLSPHVRRAHDIKPAPWPLAVAARAFMWSGIIFSTFIARDPHETLLDRRRATSAESQGSGVDAAVHRKAGRSGSHGSMTGMCPHRPTADTSLTR